MNDLISEYQAIELMRLDVCFFWQVMICIFIIVVVVASITICFSNIRYKSEAIAFSIVFFIIFMLMAGIATTTRNQSKMLLISPRAYMLSQIIGN